MKVLEAINLTKKEQVNAINTPDFQLQECEGEQISVKGYVKYITTRKARTEDEEAQQIEEVEGISIIDTDGKAYATLSATVISTFEGIIEIFGTPDEWDRSEIDKIEVITGKSNSGRKFYQVKIA